MAELLTLADVRMHLRLDADYTAEDDLITSMITAARRGCERFLNRSIIGEVRTATFAGFPHYHWLVTGDLPVKDQLVMLLTGGKLLSVNQVTYVDTSGAAQTLSPTAYAVDSSVSPAGLYPIDVWPSATDRPDAVVVQYTISPLTADDAAVVEQAMKMIIGHWYRNRESVADFRGTIVELPQSSTWLLEPLRISPFR